MVTNLLNIPGITVLAISPIAIPTISAISDPTLRDAKEIVIMLKSNTTASMDITVKITTALRCAYWKQNNIDAYPATAMAITVMIAIFSGIPVYKNTGYSQINVNVIMNNIMKSRSFDLII